MRQKTKANENEKILDFRINDQDVEKRQRGRRIRSRVIGSILLLMLFFYIPSFFYWIFSSNIDTDTIKMGNLEDSIEIDGYIVRNEIILTANQTGRFFTEINEGERVQAFSQIASVVREEKEYLFQELANVERRLIEYYKDMSRNKQIFSFEVSRIDEEIGKSVNEIVVSEMAGNISNINVVKSDIESLLQKRVQVVSKISTNDTNFKKLLDERNSIIAQIKENTTEIKSTVSGMVSYMIDGNETKFNANNLKDIKEEELLHIKNNSIFLKSKDSRVVAGKPFAKIILDNEYSVVFVMSKEQMEKFKDLRDVKIKFNEPERIMRGVVEYKSVQTTGDFIVAVKIDRGLSDMAGVRKVKLNIIKDSYSGYKVPLIALRQINETQKIAKLMVLKGGVSKLVDVKIVGSNEEFAIVDNVKVSYTSGINLYDVYVLNKSVKEGQFIN